MVGVCVVVDPPGDGEGPLRLPVLLLPLPEDELRVVGVDRSDSQQ